MLTISLTNFKAYLSSKKVGFGITEKRKNSLEKYVRKLRYSSNFKMFVLFEKSHLKTADFNNHLY